MSKPEVSANPEFASLESGLVSGIISGAQRIIKKRIRPAPRKISDCYVVTMRDILFILVLMVIFYVVSVRLR